jgi:uncharacterized protein YegJ (DUF2314 family)
VTQEAASPVFYAKQDDPEMQRAITGALASFKYLWRELSWEYRRIIPALDLSAVKAAFNDPGADPDQAEHMWLSDIEFDGDAIKGTLLSSPHGLTSVKAGDPIVLRRDHLEDWIYACKGHLYGGFTIQVIRSKMSPADRRGHDEAWGFEFAEPPQVDLVPTWGGPNAAADPEAEHPMSENMAPGLKEAVRKDPAGFFELGPSGLNMLHSLALGGSAAGVRVLLEAGADPQQKTKHGRTALDLAQLMGGPRVVELLRGR